MTPECTSESSDSVAIKGIDLRSVLIGYGFSWRKRALVRDFTGRSDVRFLSRAAAVPAGADLLLWGSAPVPANLPDGVRVVRVEDGFLRSVGLGADLTRPMSWVLDARGMYYDARTPSDLEAMLQTTVFSDSLKRRASALMEQLVRSGLSKYNVGGTPWHRPDTAGLVVLVVGQVQTDASIATGTVDVKSNMALLQTVREARPHAWIVYKPHPDVVAGLRGSGALRLPPWHAGVAQW